MNWLCRCQDVVEAFNVSSNSIRRRKRILDGINESAFFTAESRHDWSHKLLPKVMVCIQSKLNK